MEGEWAVGMWSGQLWYVVGSCGVEWAVVVCCRQLGCVVGSCGV